MAASGIFNWRDRWAIVVRMWSTMGGANVSLIAAGVAFFSMLALFPAIGALTSLYGLLANPADLPDVIDQLRAVAPNTAVDLIEKQLEAIAAADNSGLGVGAVIALLVTIWSAKAGVNAMMQGLTIVYGESEGRGFFSGLVLSYALTFLLLLLAVVAVFALVVIPAVLALLGLKGGFALWLGRWFIAMATVVIGVGALYRYGPHRKRRRSSWLSWGAALSTTLWLGVSAGLSFYIANFDSYNETYGSLGAVIALLIWFFLSAYVVLLGGSLNAETAAQVEKQRAANA